MRESSTNNDDEQEIEIPRPRPFPMLKRVDPLSGLGSGSKPTQGTENPAQVRSIAVRLYTRDEIYALCLRSVLTFSGN